MSEALHRVWMLGAIVAEPRQPHESHDDDHVITAVVAGAVADMNPHMIFEARCVCRWEVDEGGRLVLRWMRAVVDVTRTGDPHTAYVEPRDVAF